MYDFTCHECKHTFDAIVSYNKRDTFGEVRCPSCGDLRVRRHFPAPMVLQASFHDGHKRPGWDRMREAASLNKEAAVSRDDKKKEIQNEIRKLGVRVTKDIV